MIYLYTLDSHDCYGPFSSRAAAIDYADKFGLTSFQLLTKLPFEATLPITPHDPKGR